MPQTPQDELPLEADVEFDCIVPPPRDRITKDLTADAEFEAELQRLAKLKVFPSGRRSK